MDASVKGHYDERLRRQLEYDTSQFLMPAERANIGDLFEKDGMALKSGDKKQYEGLKQRLIGSIPSKERARKLANDSEAEEQIVNAVFGITGYISLLDSEFRPGYEKINELEAAVIKAATKMNPKLAYRWWG